MDVDYANDKGSYALCSCPRRWCWTPGRSLPGPTTRGTTGELTFGLLSQVSPDGKYAISTVKDRSVFVALDDLVFSQLFFPIKGILAVYNGETKTFSSLPGADDPQYVQSNPVWSPDGKYIVFARSRGPQAARNLERAEQRLLDQKECEEFQGGEEAFLFDLYRVPFNDGKGGRPEPLRGASENGMSNYFPKYSPDGKWIVFCKAKSFMLLAARQRAVHHAGRRGRTPAAQQHGADELLAHLVAQWPLAGVHFQGQRAVFPAVPYAHRPGARARRWN